MENSGAVVEIIPLTGNLYGDWNDFINISDGWFWHSTKWLDYTLAYKPELNSTSLSFLIMENSEILAICPLMLENINGVLEFSFGGSPIWSPAFSNTLSSKKIERVTTEIFKHVDKLALEHNIARASFAIYPLSNPSHNYLMKYGFLDISLNTQVIDLRHDLKYLHSDLRKGHDYDIDRGLKVLKTTVFTKDNISRNIFDDYCRLHELDSGRKTRPQITFDMQYEWIKEGNAILLRASIPSITGESVVGFSYIFTYKDKAYYGSACSHPEFSNYPIGHVLTWKTIEWLKEHDFTEYELGWQQYKTLFEIPSKKEMSISHFKKGFGGTTFPLFRGEKFYNSKFYLDTMHKRIEAYGKSTNS